MAERPHVGINDAGPGLTLGDWQIGGTVVTGTDSRHDLAVNEEHARREEEDQREAHQLGETVPDPVGEMIRHRFARPLPDPQPDDPLMAHIRAQVEDPEH